MTVRDIMIEILANIQDRVGANEARLERLEAEVAELRTEVGAGFAEVRAGFAGTSEFRTEVDTRFSELALAMHAGFARLASGQEAILNVMQRMGEVQRGHSDVLDDHEGWLVGLETRE